MFNKLKFLICLAFFLPGKGKSQAVFATVKAPEKFKREDQANSYFNRTANTFHINFQDEKVVTRCVYDTGFNLIHEYSFITDTISFSNNSQRKVKFIAPLCTSAGVFEVFSDKDDVLVFKPGYFSKKDSLCIRFKFDKKTEERIVSIMPDKEDLKILTYSEKNNYLKIYQWFPGQVPEVYQFPLSKTNLSKEEENIYTKSCQIKFKKITRMAATRINSVQSLPRDNSIFYSKNRIHVLLDIPFGVGIYIISINLSDRTIEANNYFINSLKINAADNPDIKKYPIATVVDSVLVVKNASQKVFEYLFYNINTRKLLKTYSFKIKDSIQKLIHSPIIQKGTYGSRDAEKEKNKSRNSAFQYISLSSYAGDSLTFCLFSIYTIEGIESTILSLATAPLGFMADIHIGNLQIVPYLISPRTTITYAYSKFSSKTFEPSKSNSITSNLDEIFDTVKMKQLSSNSSFFIQKEEKAFIGVFDKEKSSFNIYRFNNPD